MNFIHFMGSWQWQWETSTTVYKDHSRTSSLLTSLVSCLLPCGAIFYKLQNNWILKLLKHAKIKQKSMQCYYLNVFCSRPRQSVAIMLRFLERRNSVTSFSKLVLGAKQPVISHINSQPRSSLALKYNDLNDHVSLITFLIYALRHFQ